MPLVIALILVLSFQDQKKPDPKPPPPVVLFTAPLAVAPGETAKLTLRGLRLESVTEVKAADPRAKVKLTGKPKKAGGPPNYLPEKVGDSELGIELELPKDFPPGRLELTAVAPTGPSKPYPLTVDRPDRVLEKEPNDGFRQAQPLTLPATLTAGFHSERDVDVFRFTGKKGQRIRIEVAAVRLGSPADLILTLHDPDQQILDMIDDMPDGHPDPILTRTLPRDGDYFISLIEAHDSGGPLFPYRLLVAVEKD
jgi:hypothetical protein